MKLIILLLVAITLVVAEDPVVGGVKPADKDDPHVHELLSKHLNRLKTGDSGELTLLEVVSVTNQLVQGSLYTVKGKFQQGTQTVDCTLKVWEQSWLQGNDAVQIDAECGEPTNKKTYKSI